MKKTKLFSFIVGLVMVLGLIGSSNQANAAYDAVTFDTDTNLYLSDTGVTLIMKAGSKVAGIVVYTDYISLDLESGSLVSMTGPTTHNLTTPLSLTTCGASVSSIGFGSLNTKTVTVRPETPCQSGGGVGGGGGGGGGGGAPAPTPTPTPAASTPAASTLAPASTPAVTTTPAATVAKPISQMTQTELAAEITRLTVMLVSLQSQISGVTPVQIGMFNSELSYGLKNNSDVKRLQAFLISKGYLGAGLNTGNYFAKTVEAVKKYQSAKGITPVNGRFGPKTKAAVNAEL